MEHPENHDASVRSARQQAEQLLDAMVAAHDRGDRDVAYQHWFELRRLILARSAAEVAALEAQLRVL